MSRSIGIEAAITMPSPIDATGRLNVTMRRTGVVRQRRAPTTERRSQTRLPVGSAPGGGGGATRGTRLKASRSAPESTNEAAFRSSTSLAEVSPTSVPPRAAPATFVSVCAVRIEPLAASSWSSATSCGTTAVETILKMPVVTPQISASATMVPARPVVDHERPGGGRQQLAGCEAVARRHAVEQVPEHRAQDHGRQVLGDDDGRDVGLVAGQVEHLQLQRHDAGPGAEVRDREREPEREEAPAGRTDDRPARLEERARHRSIVRLAAARDSGRPFRCGGDRDPLREAPDILARDDA